MSQKASEVEDTLRGEGFFVSDRFDGDSFCMDFVARRDRLLLVIKYKSNMLDLERQTVDELRGVSHMLGAAPLIVSQFNSRGRLEDEAIYVRYGVNTVTPKTLCDIVVEENLPLVEVRPGGFYVQLEGDTVRENRKARNLSIGDLADIVGVSRGTIYGYERGSVKSTIAIAVKLEAAFGIPLVKPVDVFGVCSGQPSAGNDDEARVGFLGDVLAKLESLGLNVFVTRHSPFSFIASQPEASRIIGTVDARGTHVPSDHKKISSIAEVANCRFLFISDRPDRSGTTLCGELLFSLRKSKDLEEVLESTI